MAILLHEGHQLCLAKLIIAQLYEKMGSIVTRLQQDDSINLGGPIWLLQLWANAIFEPFLHDSMPQGLSKDIDGPRLCYLYRSVPRSIAAIDEFFFFLRHLCKLSFSDIRGLNLSPTAIEL